MAAQTFARDAASGVLPLAAQLFQLQGCTPERMQRDMAHQMQTSLRMKGEVSRVGCCECSEAKASRGTQTRSARFRCMNLCQTDGLILRAA